MFDPLIFPYQRVNAGAGYADGQMVTAGDFYNPVQDAIARLYGAAAGRSMSINTEELDRESNAIVVAGGLFGTQLSLHTATNGQAFSVSPIAVGDHGIWKAQVPPAGGGAAFDLVVWDNPAFIGNRQYIWSSRVRFVGSANFESVANEGVVVGLWSAVADTLPAFRWGPDAGLGEWLAYYNDGGDNFVQTGVQLQDDTWYTLVIARQSGDNKVRYYIGTGTNAPALVATSTVALGGSITAARRFMRCRGTAAAADLDGFWMDFYKRGIER